MGRALTAWAIGVVLVAGVSADEALRVRVWPAFATAPASVRIQALLAPDEGDRTMTIVVDSGEYYRHSVVALDGAKAARVHSVEYRSVPAGRYEVMVEVRDQHGDSRVRARQFFVVTQ